jgi:hypothetical protein
MTLRRDAVVPRSARRGELAMTSSPSRTFLEPLCNCPYGRHGSHPERSNCLPERSNCYPELVEESGVKGAPSLPILRLRYAALRMTAFTPPTSRGHRSNRPGAPSLYQSVLRRDATISSPPRALSGIAATSIFCIDGIDELTKPAEVPPMRHEDKPR